MQLPDEISRRLVELTEQWSRRTGKHPSEALTEYTRFIAASCLTMSLPMRQRIAIETQIAECLAREYGLPVSGPSLGSR